jgi:cytochrome c oxidase subunit II
MLAPPKIWWRKLGRLEKNWVTIAFAWCMLLTAMMPLWFTYGKQNTPSTTYRVDKGEYQELVNNFAEEYKIGEENGIPIVKAPPGDVYMYGRQWQWYPILVLEKGEEYRLHISSLDVNHGFSLQPNNLNYQILPGYDYVITITPTTSGEVSIICNEYCLVGHHIMVGKMIVED